MRRDLPCTYSTSGNRYPTHKTREPGPYWPDRGQAHMTCRALSEAFVAAADSEELVGRFRVAKAAVRKAAEDNAGMLGPSAA